MHPTFFHTSAFTEEKTNSVLFIRQKTGLLFYSCSHIYYFSKFLGAYGENEHLCLHQKKNRLK